MRRWFGLTLAAGLIAIVIVLASADGDHAFSLGVLDAAPIAQLPAGRSICQREVPVPATGEFREIRLGGTDGLDVTVRDAARPTRTVARGRLAGALVRLDHVVPGDSVVDVCLRAAGPGSAAIPGAEQAAVPSTYAELGGKRLSADIALDFACGCGRSALGNLRNEMRNAALFKLAWGRGVIGVLVALALLLGVPGLLWLALGPSRPVRDG